MSAESRTTKEEEAVAATGEAEHSNGCSSRKRPFLHRRSAQSPPRPLPSHPQGTLFLLLSLSLSISLTFSFSFSFLSQVDQMWSADKYNSGPFDRFSLLIPYCLDFIRWDVIFDAESPNVAPDVIFGPEDDSFHPFHMLPSPESNNNCLSDWNYKDPSRLLTLIQFLRDQYVLYQRKRVEEVDDERLKFEISTILSREGIEMYMGSNAEKLEEVKFAVPLLDMNINNMVSCCPWRYSQKIYLQVVYPVGRKYTSVPSAPRLKLVSSPELKAVFSIDDVKLPSWVDGMCLAEYLPNLEEYLGKQVFEAVSLIEVRRQFIEALASPFGRPIEADPVSSLHTLSQIARAALLLYLLLTSDFSVSRFFAGRQLFFVHLVLSHSW
ncbi:hypothetical protein V8G54_027290 [Vigna mungo]|uniref:BRISC and BRCA1-A complex member 2 n=1 Tax=Vigna mungo TaxID=3915 RepID=A0AAQ3N2K4_VIGMU